MNKNQRREIVRAFSFLSQIGVTIAACVIIGVFFGKFIDSLLGTNPVFLIVFALLGVGAAFRSIFKIIVGK